MPPIEQDSKSDGGFLPMKKHGCHSAKIKLFDNNNFFSPKKRRIQTADQKEELTKLFDKISKDPFYENDIPTTTTSINTDGNTDSGTDTEVDEPVNLQDIENQLFFNEDQRLDWLYEDSSSEEGDIDPVSKMSSTSTATTTDDLTALATEFLEQEQTDQLKEALDGTDHTQDDTTYYRFFSKRCQIPTPTLKYETLDITDSLSKSRYNYVIKNSDTETKRKLLLSSGVLIIWYQRGWNCPHSIYQWLVEIVGYEKDVLVAKEAMTTLTSLWSNLPNEPLPLHPPISDNINYNRNLSSTTFINILISYGALELTTQHAPTTFISSRRKNDPMTGDHKIPLVQFQWVLQLFTRSLTLWPQSYSGLELAALSQVFLHLGVDNLGILLVKPIQDALEACLLAIPDFNEAYVNRLAGEVCMRFSKVESQVRLARVAKSTCPRSICLRRVIAVTALSLVSVEDPGEELEIDRDLPLAYLINLLNKPSGIFKQADPNYRKLLNCIYLLDYGIGTDLMELASSTETVDSLVTQLQAMGRKIGSRLGALDKTKANEATQRLWSRLSYVLDRWKPSIQDTDL